MKIYIKKGEIYSKPIEYILYILGKNKSETFIFTDKKNNSEIIVDHEDPLSVPICIDFYKNLLINNSYSWEFYFKDKLNIQCNDGRIDHLSTAFYMVNSFQEYNASAGKFDNYGRFMFDFSYQKKFGCIEENLVQKHFDLFCKENFSFNHLSLRIKKTKVFVSHDIDTIYGSFFEDGLWALNKGRIDIILKLLMQAILLKPDWVNMDKIVKINNEYDVKSTFFWLVNKGRGIENIKNADYSVKKIKNIILKLESFGLHKSCTTDSFNDELAKFSLPTHLNRYHFLKFQIPSAWNEIEKSPIKFDASLGFGERYGFRNNYGLPFQPYNIKENRRYDFLEVPLHLMDGTFHRSMKIPKNKTAELIIQFFEKNSENCILSLLWHNTYFTNYKYNGYLDEYKKILSYFHDTGLQSVTPREILNEYYENR